MNKVMFIISVTSRSIRVAFGHEVCLVILANSCLKFPDALKGQLSILVAFNVFFSMLTHFEVDFSILFLIDF